MLQLIVVAFAVALAATSSCGTAKATEAWKAAASESDGIAAALAYTTTPEAFGAVGDGKADDWAAIQKAVASCSSQSLPCTVIFARSYLSGPIVLNASDTTLDVRGHLAMLPKGSYPQNTAGGFISNGNGDESQCRTRYGGYRVCLRNLRLTGGGVVSSTSPWSWWACKILGCWRPHLITMAAVDGLTVDNITLVDSPNHHIEMSSSVGVRVRGLRVSAPHYSPNTDGINFYGGFDQSLTDSIISNGDDCVSVVPVGLQLPQCVSAPEALQCHGGNVVVRNVTCVGGHGISIGGVRHGSVSNVTFSNMTATGESTSTQGEYSTGGVRIKSYPNSTGLVHDIRFTDIRMDNVYLPLQLLGHYCPWPCTTPDGNTSVLFRDIEFARITGTGSQAHAVGVLACSKLRPCGNITLTGIQLEGSSGGASAAVVTCSNAPSVAFDEGSSPSACSTAVARVPALRAAARAAARVTLGVASHEVLRVPGARPSAA